MKFFRQLQRAFKIVLLGAFGVMIVWGVVHGISFLVEVSEYGEALRKSFNESALVIGREVTWEQAKGDILEIFNIDDNPDEWKLLNQYIFKDEFIDMWHYKSWEQCIEKGGKTRICREEIWVYDTIEERWILIIRWVDESTWDDVYGLPAALSRLHKNRRVSDE